MKRAIGIDTETHLIRPGVQFPPVVCLQFYELYQEHPGERWHLFGSPSILHTADLSTDHMNWILDHDLIFGAIVAYDVGVLIGRHPDLKRKWFEAYRDNRVTDICTRQKLLDLAAGCYRGYPGADGEWVHYGYDLDSVQHRYTDIRLKKDSEWRLRYAELEGVPIVEWPEDAVSYALADVRTTAVAFQGQEDCRFTAGADNFPGRDALTDEFNRSRTAFWLKLMSAYGLRTDRDAVYSFARDVQSEYLETAEALTLKGLIKKEYERPREKVREYAEKTGQLHKITDGSGAVTLTSKALIGSGDPILALCAQWDSIKAGLRTGIPSAILGFESLRSAGIASFSYKRDTKAASLLCERTFLQLGLKPPITKGGAIALDKETLSRVSEECEELKDYAELSSLSKTLSTDIPILLSGADYPISSHFEEMEATGRTGSSAPNVQNIRRKAGIRECFIPRHGCVYIDADYSMLELHTHAQICLWLFGYSRLAEILNAGQDPHSQVASVILGMSYEDVIAAKDAGDPHVSNVRDCAKVNNFGRRGGLGDEKLVAYAAKSYGVKITLQMAATLKEAGETTFPEMKDYAKYINGLESFPDSGRFNTVSPHSNRLRADSTYCSAMNTLFQGLGADVATLAGWYLTWACYVDEGSPLYNARPVNFPHDQFLVECDEATAADGAREVERLMNAAGKAVLPDVPVKAKPLLARRWSKLAKRLTDKNGKLIPWEPK